MTDITVAGVLSSYGIQPDDLEHHGRLGMKWGKHVFGDRPGQSKPQSKATIEAKNVVRRNNVVATGRVTGAAAGAVAGYLVADILRSKPVKVGAAYLIGKTLGYNNGLGVVRALDTATTVLASPLGRRTLAAGGAYLGATLGGKAGKAINVRIDKSS